MPDMTPSWRLFQVTQQTDGGSWPGDTVLGGGGGAVHFIQNGAFFETQHCDVPLIYGPPELAGYYFFRTSDIRFAS